METTPSFSFAKNRAAASSGILFIVLTDKKITELVRTSEGRELHFGMGAQNGAGQSGRKELISVVRRVIAAAKQYRVKRISISFDDFRFAGLDDVSDKELAVLLAENIVMANFEFVHFKTKPKDGWNFIEQVVVTGTTNRQVKNGFERGRIVGEEVNKSRILANTPGGDMTPKKLAAAARSAVKGTKANVTVLGRNELKKQKMGAVLGVAQGSSEEPQFIIMEYKGAASAKAPIVLVGKGVTFDTGGLNLKPSHGIFDMYMDMSGGAAVIHAVALAARLGVKRNIIGLVPAVENMPSGSSYRPGDILQSMSGKTIEVRDTDAEGRIIMADALHYAKRYKPALVVDIATLTGGAVVALGQRVSALFAPDEDTELLFRELGEESGDYVWPLPLEKENEDDVKGVFGDVANLPTAINPNYGSAISAAAFLKQFTKNEKGKPAYPWVHLDIAPRMTTVPSDYLAKGSAGAPVRLLIKLLEEYK